MRKTSEEKRANIIAAAGSLFTQQGVEATSMDEIAQRAEVSKQTLYSHFGSKEGLFAAAIRDKCVLNELGEDFFDRPGQPQELLLAFAKQCLQLMLGDDGLQMQRTCIAQGQMHSNISQLFYDTGPALLMQALQAYLQRLHADKRLNVGDCRAASWQFIFMLRGDVTFRSLLGIEQLLNDVEIDDYLKNCVAMFLRAYAA